MVLSVVGLRVDCAERALAMRPGIKNQQEHSHPGSSMGSLSVSAEEKHSTSAISESEEATNAPSAASCEGELNRGPRHAGTKPATHLTREFRPDRGIQAQPEWISGSSPSTTQRQAFTDI